MLDLSPLMKKPVRNLSLGERMKCEIAAALLHRPKVVFLDEPMSGLDPVGMDVMRETMLDLRRRVRRRRRRSLPAGGPLRR